ncbi:MAG: hypothetical protein ACOCXA_05075, partial [Planctomycetota bacterium]
NMLEAADTPAASGLQLPPGFADHQAYRDSLMETLRAPRPDCQRYDPLPAQLFDLDADPGEEHDLSTKQPEQAARLRRALEGWFERILPEAESYRPVA